MGKLCGQLNGNYSSISSTLSESAKGLRSSAQEYKSQDHADAERLDKVYKPSGVPPLDDGIDTQGPAAGPRSKLTEPGTEGAIPSLVDHILGGAGYFSISTLVEQIVKLCGFDIQGWVTEKFVGDFSTAAKSKNAVKNLAEFDHAAATTVADGCSTMMKSWNGHAAAGAHGYFDKLANALDGEGGELDGIVRQYDAVVLAIQQGGDAIMRLIE